MYTLTILHERGVTTTDRLNRINQGSGGSLDKFTDAVREWELAKEEPDVRAAFLMNGGIVIRRWEK